jgi:DNA-binding protein H-NS
MMKPQHWESTTQHWESPQHWESMSVEALWFLHEQVASVLVRKIADEKARLDQRLRQLKFDATSTSKRPHRRVFPKYQNPAHPDETWSGRGRKPSWLTAQLRSGRKLDDFLIQPS